MIIDYTPQERLAKLVEIMAEGVLIYSAETEKNRKRIESYLKECDLIPILVKILGRPLEKEESVCLTFTPREKPYRNQMRQS